jgi:hypothetical protein
MKLQWSGPVNSPRNSIIPKCIPQVMVTRNGSLSMNIIYP